jgi:GNAT superfamily N-acetyltransferase
MSISLGNCCPEDLDQLIKLLDNEFVTGKGYSLSLAKRFLNVINPDNLTNIYLLKDKEKIFSSVVVKIFEWLFTGIKWKCAMIGMVYTIPEARGQGFSRKLMKFVQEQIFKKGIDFAVLFTSIPEFYLPLGWVQRDTGVWGHISFEGDHHQSNDEVISMPIKSDTVHVVESLRSRWCQNYIFRNDRDYLILPRPSEYIKLLYQKDQSGYAILGGIASDAYIYEMHGTEITFKSIWNVVISQFCTVYVNDYECSPSMKWFSKNVNISWKKQSMAMWLYLSEASLSLQKQHLPVYVPYFDRI